MQNQTELIAGERTQEKKQESCRLRQLKVEVTSEIIATSERANSSHCMISDATKESARKNGYRIGRVATDLQTIRFTDLQNGWRYVYLTPRIGQVKLVDFDAGDHTEPFEFVLRPVQIIKKGKPRKGSKGSKHQTLKREERRKRSKASLSIPPDSTAKPIVIDGHTPPVAALPGARREFGLHSLRAHKQFSKA